MSEPFLGQIILFPGNFAIRGWAKCDGQLLPISQNVKLFSLVGNTYGGDGRTTFALPDLRGRVPIHAGAGPGLTSRELGEKIGNETQTITVSQIPPHSHTLRGYSEIGNSSDPAGNTLADSIIEGEPVNAYSSQAANTDLGDSIGDTGGGGSINIMQPSLALHYLIALQGIFPSR